MALKFFKKKRKKAAAKRKPKPKPKKVKAKKPVKKAKIKLAKKPKKVRRVKAKPAVQKVPDEKAYEILKKAKIPVVPHAFIKSERDLPRAFKRLGFPLVLKASGPSIVHKTEIGGIKYASNSAEATEAFKKLAKIKGVEKVLVQKRLSGLELIVGAKSDPQFGYVVSVGIGGIYVEVLRDVAFRIVPLSLSDAVSMVKELKGYDILAGLRGRPSINFDALYDVLIKVGKIAAKEKIKEIDINPLFCNKEGCWAADVRIIK